MTERMSSVHSRQLGVQMRQARQRTGLTSAEAARRIGVSPSKLSRLENGLRAAKVTDVNALLEVYEVPVNQRTELLDLAGRSTRASWQRRFRSRLPRALRTLIGQENNAVRIRAFDTTTMPALLQTGEYARAVLSASATVPTLEVEEWVTIRLARQTVLARPIPPEFGAIITEPVLRSPVGGHGVHQAQLRHLMALAQRSNIELLVLPAVASPIAESFLIMDFPSGDSAVHRHPEGSERFAQDPAAVAGYQRRYRALAGACLDPATSAALIASLVR
jgi:transcriptional regulator with XRE-family HTH domain